jgi:23S rRNA (uracil1939-C5)-methyltransferase
LRNRLYLRGFRPARRSEFVSAAKIAAKASAWRQTPRLALVACDPATVARDVAGILAAGYRIERLAMVGLFPQIFHPETVVALRL